MTDDDEYETDRLKAVAEHYADEKSASTTENLEDRYGPESHGCHEALHVTHLVLSLIDRELAEHGAIIQNPEWYRHIRRAQGELAALYQKIGAVHLGGPSAKS